MTKKLLFVCLGNICRSPAAEAVMNHLVQNGGLDGKIICDSAGTGGYHSGEPADARMRAHGGKRGYNLTSIARKVYPDQDYTEFDYILAMDRANFGDLQRLAHGDELKDKLFLMCDFCSVCPEQEVPDPYFGGEAGFERVLDILEDACRGLLERVKKEL